MKVKDLFTITGTWDVYENIADQVGAAFVSDGTYPLTEEGTKKFKKALNLSVKRIDNNMIVIDTESVIPQEVINLYSFESYDECPTIIRDLIDLFWFHAGYCSVEEYNKYFKENNQ